ncbi:hypothetical protein QQ045_006762 [Rhodiola kirilowii]
MKLFRDCLDDCELSDLGFMWMSFTYSNKRKGEDEVKARLDRVVANEQWRTSFSRAVVKHEIAYSLDHSHVFLCLKDDIRRKHHQLRRFEPMWLRHKEFKEEFRRAWSGESGETSLSVKLKRCMWSFHQWAFPPSGGWGER